MSTEDTTVRISLRDVYEVVQRLDERTLKMEQLIPTSHDHEQRIRRVERWVYALPPTFILAIVSAAVTLSKR